MTGADQAVTGVALVFAAWFLRGTGRPRPKPKVKVKR